MPINPTDAHRGVKIDSPLGEDLVCRSVVGKECLGRMFEFHLDLLSLNPDLQFKDIVGQRVTITLELLEGERYFDGFVSEFRYMGSSGQFAWYKATLKPWLWFLTRTADCRIFQNQNVPDIIKSVFRDNGMSDFKDSLSDSYRTWVYCTQYRETDFNFVSRLMEQEGIYYFFEHTKGKHTLVLADGVGAHKPFPGYETVPYYPRDSNAALRERDHIQNWETIQSIVPGKFSIKDFDFEKPKVDLTAKLSKDRPHAYPIADHEIFDYPGEYSEKTDGDSYVKKKLQELQAQHERVLASGSARGMCSGSLFTLENFPRKDQEKEYLIISVTHDFKSDPLETSGGAGEEEFYNCQFEAMDSSEQYRSEQTTPKSIVQGPQTAIVVGPAGEEIYCDEYSRVKVQFHWDRYGQNDQNSSCWVRVSQAWAGKAWGAIHIPRIGQEVLVSFLEGDPDAPLITGRVYNAVNMPPYELESNKTQSGIKSRSSKGGTPSNFNEIRMEDKKGSEELYIQAERNQTNITKNDRNENVGHNHTLTVQNDFTMHVGYEKADPGSYVLNVCQDRIESVSNGNYNLGVDTGSRNTFIKTDDNLEVKGNRNEKITNSLSAKAKNVAIKGTSTYKAESPDVQIVGSTSTKIGSAIIQVSGSTVTVTGTTEVSLAVGGSSIKINPGGITITGPMVKINT